MPSFQVPVLGSTVRFLSLFPVSLPQPFLRCLPSALRFRYFPLSVRFLSSALFKLPATQLSVSSFPSLPGSAHQLAFPVPDSAFAFSVFPFISGLISRAFLPGFCTRLSVCFLLPFPDSLPQLFLRCLPYAFTLSVFPLSIRFLSSASLPVPATQLSVSSFPFSFRFCLNSAASSVYQFLLSLLLVFPVLSDLVFHVFFPGFRTRLSVSFLSSFPVSLPQLFHRCLPFAFAFGIFPCDRFLSSAFV